MGRECSTNGGHEECISFITYLPYLRNQKVILWFIKPLLGWHTVCISSMWKLSPRFRVLVAQGYVQHVVVWDKFNMNGVSGVRSLPVFMSLVVAMFYADWYKSSTVWNRSILYTMFRDFDLFPYSCDSWSLYSTETAEIIKRMRTNYMELSPSWEAASCAVTQEFLNTLRNPKVNYYVHKSPLPVPILSQINPAHTTPFYLSKIHFNIILVPSGLFPSGFPIKILYAILFFPTHAAFSAHIGHN
jgi:hypothetical protein